MDYVTLPAAPKDEAAQRVSALCRGIEKKARLKGNTAVLMELDRIPNLLLGPVNRVPEGAQDAAIVVAMAAIERITISNQAGQPSA